MPVPNIGALRAVGDRLDRLGLRYAFVGGSIVNLLIDNPQFAPARPTDDVDVILGVVTDERYSAVEDRLRRLGFSNDTREGAPICRWMLGNLTVDIMPTEGSGLGLNTAWFKEALATATEEVIANTRLKLISPAAFLATKYVAFIDRGAGDYRASHDLEDLITVVDGRESIVADVNYAPHGLRDYVIAAVKVLTAASDFNEALPGHLPPDQFSQQRLPKLRVKLRGIASL
jgi:predicted nucleotidyltransferase